MSRPCSSQRKADGKVVDGSLLGDANGVDPAPSRAKDSGKWQKPRFSRKALMKCCLVKWIIASTQPQDKVLLHKLGYFIDTIYHVYHIITVTSSGG
ncbi:Calsenilin A-type potassium channel modulatory protein 3 DRE-antagonist modulator [Collichthys lucidus]|uniref:Calsenilin A-type potassium channel modulatory protein 3 DRE-antagonist modulator n=1 Tax=Collichthys lucidus TaxID=240159 RepID=A0A4U5UTN8_COLLU|nr:Calsenilin A-type potassium channel modulatory protein 3 DRE-antagonist modulator [Collichthys lucidus]